jgi:RNase P subunit RPR2
VRRLPAEDEQEILNLLLQGVAYRKISRQRGTSISSVARIAEDARKETPDFDSLRGLSVLLKKAGLSVFDATRASRLMEVLSTWGISVDELGDYVRVNEKFLKEKVLSEDFIFYAMKLAQLEQAYGRPYQEAVEDFEKKGKEAAEAEERKMALDNESLVLKAELNETREGLAELKSEIETANTARKGLAEIGLHKLAQLVRFIQDFESLGFDAKQVKRLVMWYRGLQKLHIDPDELDKYIAERGPLENQNNSLRLANERIEADVDAHAIRRTTLVAENFALQAVDLILRTGTLTMRCKSCGHPLPIGLPTQESFWNLTNTGQVLSFQCQSCGMPQVFTPWEIAFHIAWVILPTNQKTT